MDLKDSSWKWFGDPGKSLSFSTLMLFKSFSTLIMIWLLTRFGLFLYLWSTFPFLPCLNYFFHINSKIFEIKPMIFSLNTPNSYDKHMSTWMNPFSCIFSPFQPITLNLTHYTCFAFLLLLYSDNAVRIKLCMQFRIMGGMESEWMINRNDNLMWANLFAVVRSMAHSLKWAEPRTSNA